MQPPMQTRGQVPCMGDRLRTVALQVSTDAMIRGGIIATACGRLLYRFRRMR